MRNITLFIFLIIAGKTAAQLRPEQWRADLEYLGQELPKRHPDFFKNHREADFRRDLKTLSENLAGHTDLEIALEAQALVARAGDAQTKLDLTPFLQRTNPIPIGLGWYADGVYVSGTVKRFERALGKKVLTINDLPIETALEKIGRFAARETALSPRKDALPWFRFPAADRLAGVSATDTLELLLEDAAGRQERLRVFPLDASSRADMQPAQFQPKDPDLRWQPVQDLFNLRWLPADSVLYVQYNRCRSREMALAAGDSLAAERLPPFTPFADSIVAFLRQTPGAKLFIDLRFNGGGGATDGLALAQRLAEIPAVNRPDKLFVATNLYTFSSAVQVAAYFDEKTNAALIGEPPSQGLNHFDEARSFGLPNSGLKVFYSTKFVQMTPLGSPELLTPNVLIQQRFEQFRDGKDPVLDFVRARRD